MKNSISIFGGGNMGRAIVEGLLRAKIYLPENIFVYDVNPATRQALQEVLHVQTPETPEAAVKAAQTLLFAVKPNILPELMRSIAPKITTKQIVISIAAGITLAQLEGFLSTKHKIVRVMPNTPALVGEGMSAVAPNANLSAAEKEKVMQIFMSFGKAEMLDEHLIDATVGVSGSSPAYVYMFIEALADGAVLEGMPRQMAYEFAAQAVLGSAKMVLETGEHPGTLKDQVTSPGGTTIAAVASLEAQGFRASVIEAVRVAAEKNKQM